MLWLESLPGLAPRSGSMSRAWRNNSTWRNALQVTAVSFLLPACCDRLLLFRLSKQSVYFFVCCLREVLVPIANAVERFRCFSANDLVYQCAKLFTRLRSGYRNGNDDTGGMLLSQCFYSSTHSCTCGQAIIYEDDCAIAYVWWGTAIPVKVFTPFEFLLFFCCDLFYHSVGDMQHLHNIFVEYAYTS